jgi:hypothetical protein
MAWNLNLTLGSELLAGGLASGGFTSGLLSTGHFNSFCVFTKDTEADKVSKLIAEPNFISGSNEPSRTTPQQSSFQAGCLENMHGF